MPDPNRTGEEGKGDTWTGTSEGPESSLDDAIRQAVNNANQPHRTWLVLGPIAVLSVDDPNVGGYKATVSKI
ncbi:MAG TPA: hypothetical protein VI540_00235 [Gaiellaceae bacterium]|nr:hypothetical protein [Gaiellaceae bacterium]